VKLILHARNVIERIGSNEVDVSYAKVDCAQKKIKSIVLTETMKVQILKKSVAELLQTGKEYFGRMNRLLGRKHSNPNLETEFEMDVEDEEPAMDYDDLDYNSDDDRRLITSIVGHHIIDGELSFQVIWSDDENGKAVWEDYQDLVGLLTKELLDEYFDGEVPDDVEQLISILFEQ
jgi:hypothetical protein